MKFPKPFLFLLLMITYSACQNKSPDYKTWEVRGGGHEQNRYSELSQIDTSNVSGLEIAWTYQSGDLTHQSTQIQANPIIIDGVLFGTSPNLKVFALDASSGQEIWSFDPFGDENEQPSFHVNRGVSYWEGDETARILFSAGSFLYAVDAGEGTLLENFGEAGRVSLKEGFDEKYQDYYSVATSPGVVYQDLIIIGSRVSEGADAAPGDIKAFNVKTGELVWTFHTIPRPGEFGHETWEDPDAWQRIGGANSWAGMALDEERGIVYIPTGSASPDFYGGNRRGENLFANSLLALDASTGERIWHYQTVYHDLWDRDLPSAPSLVSVHHNGKKIDAISQTTKMGTVFLFDRETGEPLFEIEEQPVPTESDLEGEVVWPAQPMPVRPEPLMRQQMGPDDINPYVSEQEQETLREILTGLKSDHMFSPPSLQGTLMFPGFDGGAEWGGSAFDPETGFLYVNTNEVPWILQMIDTQPQVDSDMIGNRSIAVGRTDYMKNCVACHGSHLQGSGRSPSLMDVGERISPGEMLSIMNSGQGMMPAFSHITEDRKKAVVNFLMNKEHFELDEKTLSDGQELMDNSGSSERYILNGYQKFRTAEGFPANSPPWGRLSAVNLNTGEIVWQIPLGEYPELAARGITPTGTENYGGPVVTKGGVLFIAATLDKKIRAFNKKTGDLIWEAELPYAAYATPAIYEVEGKQFLVIACGGGKLGSESGDAWVAFAIPDSRLDL